MCEWAVPLEIQGVGMEVRCSREGNEECEKVASDPWTRSEANEASDGTWVNSNHHMLG
jgi:hypothetical protein